MEDACSIKNELIACAATILNAAPKAFCVLLVGYSFGAATVMQIEEDAKARVRQLITVPITPHGCFVDAEVGKQGKRIRLVLDSGADGGVFMPIGQASNLGLDPNKLNFNHSSAGIGGTVPSTETFYLPLRISAFVDPNVGFQIYKPKDDGVHEPLLGRDVLRNLNFSMGQYTCTLDLGPR